MGRYGQTQFPWLHGNWALHHWIICPRTLLEERLGSRFLPLTADVTTSSKISFTTSWAPSSVPTHTQRHKHIHVGISRESEGRSRRSHLRGKEGKQVLSPTKNRSCTIWKLRQRLPWFWVSLCGSLFLPKSQPRGQETSPPPPELEVGARFHPAILLSRTKDRAFSCAFTSCTPKPWEVTCLLLPRLPHMSPPERRMRLY